MTNSRDSSNKSLEGNQRRFSEQTLGLASVLLVAGIAVMANYVAFRRYERIDMTSVGMFTLSGKSVQVLNDLKEPVDLYLFMSRGEGNFEQADELLKRFQAASEKIVVHYVDPEREETEFRLLAQRFGISAGMSESGSAMADVAAVLARGEKRWHVSRDDMLGLDLGPVPGEDEISINVQAEQALVGAIVQVTSGRATKLCVTEGHGEWSIDESSERALITFKTSLRHDNIEWRSIKTLGKTSIPDSCDAVLVLGPTAAFSESEANLIATYLSKGGNALLALDPNINRDLIEPSGFEGMLEQQGVRLEPALALEANEEYLLGPNMAEFVVTDFNDHETTRLLQGRGRVFVALARAISPTGTNDGVSTLLRTSSAGFGKTELGELTTGTTPTSDAGDVSGPVGLAVAVRVAQATEKQPADDAFGTPVGGRLVVLGDTDFLQGPLLETPELTNLEFATAIIGFVSEREALISIAPKKVKGGSIVLSQDDLSALFFRVVVLLPAAALLLGVGVWMSRKS